MNKNNNFFAFRALKVFFFVMGAAVLPLSANANGGYEKLKIKAERFYSYGEWESASAAYELILMQKFDDVDAYSRAITVKGILGRSDEQIAVVEQSQKNGISMMDIFKSVRMLSYSLGKPKIYESLLLIMKEKQPWMRRSINVMLAEYYSQRNNAPKMVAYADTLLSTRADDLFALRIKSRGQMLRDDYVSSVSTNDRIIALEPTDIEAYLNNGVYFFNMWKAAGMASDKSRAIHYLSKAYKLRNTPYLKDRLVDLGVISVED